jgi:drug/metabolite transporter (DMT)-like permease
MTKQHEVHLVGTADSASGVGPTTANASAMLVVVILMYGLVPPLTKLISAPALAISGTRMTLAIPIAWLLLYSSGGRISSNVLKRTLVPGIVFGLSNVLLVSALQHASVAVVAVVTAIQPGIVLIFAGRWLGERPTRWHVIWTGIGVAGLAVAILGGNPAIRGDALGVLLAIGAVVTFSAYYVLNRHIRLTSTINPVEWMAGITVFGAMSVAPVALLAYGGDVFDQFSRRDWIYVGVLVVVSLTGHTLMSAVHKFVAAARSSLLFLGVNVVSIVAAWAIHDEPITVIQGIGCAIVLGSVAAVVKRRGTVTVATPIT